MCWFIYEKKVLVFFFLSPFLAIIKNSHMDLYALSHLSFSFDVNNFLKLYLSQAFVRYFLITYVLGRRVIMVFLFQNGKRRTRLLELLEF